MIENACVSYVLERTQWFPRPLQEVFSFFADPHNLNDITPPSLHFRVLTPAPVAMQPGTLIDYRLKLYGLPLKWRTRISLYEPPHRFIDEQLRGPYSRWVHEHTFRPETVDGVAGTLMTDHVSYALPRWSPGFLNSLIHKLFVAPDLDRIFGYRRQVLGQRFSPK